MSSATTEQLIELLRSRDALGAAKYGTTMDRTDLTPEQWLQHMVEELLDGAGYALAAAREMRGGREDNLIVPQALWDEMDRVGLEWKARAEAAEAEVARLRASLAAIHFHAGRKGAHAIRMECEEAVPVLRDLTPATPAE